MPPKHNPQCVNCAINIQRRLRRLMAAESEDMRQLLSDWACKELNDHDAVCGPCHYLLEQKLKSNDKTRAFGFNNICLSCGTSILTKRAQDLTVHPEEKLVIAHWIPSHQIKRLKRVCYSCWMRAQNAVIKNKTAINNQVIKMEENDDPLVEEDEVFVPTSLLDPDDIKQEIEVPAPYSIAMATYRRAASSSSRCIFKKCKHPERLIFPNLLKERLLIEYSLYVPKPARICFYHLNSSHNEWGELFDQNERNDFNVDQLEDLCSLFKDSANRYYSNDTFQSLIKRKSFLCKYWFGVDYEQFEAMLEALKPVVHRLKFVKKSLSMYLMRRHTGLADKKIASFFKISTELMFRNIGVVHGCLVKDDNFVGCEEVHNFSCKEENVSLQENEVGQGDNSVVDQIGDNSVVDQIGDNIVVDQIGDDNVIDQSGDNIMRYVLELE